MARTGALSEAVAMSRADVDFCGTIHNSRPCPCGSRSALAGFSAPSSMDRALWFLRYRTSGYHFRPYRRRGSGSQPNEGFWLRLLWRRKIAATQVAEAGVYRLPEKRAGLLPGGPRVPQATNAAGPGRGKAGAKAGPALTETRGKNPKGCRSLGCL